ncbi:hypothetical protein WICPIJ_005860 [Wickerhamomyces pijperi]|uniref:Golgi apparatus membrane protein TVP18 n=1 Tax=Wickerhamomyces pijperi TaxID=599730 RepID=A0A9P8TKQ4_WICPI|nr:hypothetical protein WICPIJ_005860 [Wickerhamomyces pijperi]
MAINPLNFINKEGLKEDLYSRNWSVYGQWLGIFSILLSLIFGIANIFHFSTVIVFSILAIVQGLVILFVEVPFLLKICPMSENFTTFIQKFNNNWPRVAFYAIMAVIQWLSLLTMATSLLVLAVVFTLCAIFYAIAALKHQKFQNASNVVNTDVTTYPAETFREIL